MEHIPPELNPDFIDGIKAKSRDMGGDTLAQHTWAVLARLADQRRLRPHLAEQFGDPRLWLRLYWGCFLHDFGKAAAGFQERLQDDPPPNDWSEGRHRHEVLSLAFVDWMFPRDHPDRLPIIGVIAAHHKDLNGENGILPRYGAIRYDDRQRARLQFLIDQLDSPTIDGLWRWLTEFGNAWAAALGFGGAESIQPARRAVNTQSIMGALDDLVDYAQDQRGTAVSITLRGLILTADHAASANTDPFPNMPLNEAVAAKPTQGFTLRRHQTAARETAAGSHLLIAPTGSGKTEAALLWAARQMALYPSARLFYTLPYQASMNAMADRLWTRYFRRGDSAADFSDETVNRAVMIQHSRATLHLYQQMMTADSGAAPRAVADLARRQRDRARLNFYPLQVFSPYQMLKAAFSLKGYEALLLDYTGGLFIFDEIHAYDPERLALILEMMRWLRVTFGARFFVMTATLPPHLQARLMDALGIGADSALTADSATFAESQRHIVRLLEGALTDDAALVRMLADYHQGKTVLVCCNQVQRALALYDALRAHVEPERILLLHSRFNGGDRADKERRLLEAFHLRPGWQARGGRPPCIVVATQVIEVSLDVDFDTIYTEPAPLEALIQRFGRVNRARADHALVDVHVMRQPVEGGDVLPYDEALVRRSLGTLEQRCADRPIDEGQVSAMLGEIYQGDLLADWDRRFEGKTRDLRRILQAMRPFQSADEATFQQFYQMFDGVQVLPLENENDFLDAWENRGFLDASRFLVNISWRQYAMLRSRGRLMGTGERDDIPRADVPYDPERGLDLYHEAVEDSDE
ncbi:MAG: CRISPR-associated helicase Cas3' [Anaerolineae bacterium]|nr:CRISPR-associated helicase Cas3' [Anaerolineae bacterium]NUQ04756.1 CRISPR-associated helicase Cas3' [Anaerolineae bacterium]